MAVKPISAHLSALKFNAPEIDGFPPAEVEVDEKGRKVNIGYKNEDGTMVEIAIYHHSGEYWTLIAPKFCGGRFVTVSISDIVNLQRTKVSRYGTKSLAQHVADWAPVAAQYLSLPGKAEEMMAKARKTAR